MTKYGIKIEAKQGELEGIFEELEKAQEKIYECYCKLQQLGVLIISEAKEAAPEK